ncbi:hypothetical protein, partial [Methyloglobulus sp.]|uniref:hypothetical protein n=1 Tax=Methyloglobulus sp. TaxID=2518622 RepID=UPI003989ACEE
MALGQLMLLVGGLKRLLCRGGVVKSAVFEYKTGTLTSPTLERHCNVPGKIKHSACPTLKPVPH